jgi:anti-anti-sigma factor
MVARVINPLPPPLAIERSDCTLVLCGDVDAHTASLLAAELDDVAAVHRLELDASAVSFIDSTGLRTILAEHRRRQAERRELVVVRPSAPMIRLIEVTGLVSYLSVEPPLGG